MTIGKPAIYIPFGVTFPLDRISDEAAGKLLKELLVYGQWGVSDHIPDEALPLWMVLSGYIKLDDVAYSMRSRRSRYQFYLRHMEGKGEAVLDFDGWMEAYGKYDQMDPLDMY